MDIRHLRYFLALAEELHFGRAAIRAHIEQSPLSRTITQLEDELGVPLFIRSRQGTTLTPAGEALRDPAREILTTIERARRMVAAAGGLAPVLRIGLCDGLAQPRLSLLFQHWRETEPATPSRIRELPSFELREALQTEHVDLGLSFGVARPEGLVAEPLWHDPIVVAVPRGHVLAEASSLTLEAVAAFPLVLCHPRVKPGLRAQLDAVLQDAGITPILAEPAETLAGIIVKVGAGCGLGFLDAAQAQALQRADIVMVPLATPMRLTTFALRKAGRQDDLANAMDRFVALARTIA